MSRNRRYPLAVFTLAIVIGMQLGGGLLAGQADQPEAEQTWAGQSEAARPEDGQQDEERSTWLLLPVMITGMATLGVFAFRMSRTTGIGPYDLKAVGIVLIATIVGLLVAHGGDVPASAATILGAIAGYLFGTKTDPAPPNPPAPNPPAPNPPAPNPPAPNPPAPNPPAPNPPAPNPPAPNPPAPNPPAPNPPAPNPPAPNPPAPNPPAP